MEILAVHKRWAGMPKKGMRRKYVNCHMLLLCFEYPRNPIFWAHLQKTICRNIKRFITPEDLAVVTLL